MIREVTVRTVEELDHFLETATLNWPSGQVIHRCRLPSSQIVSCVQWEGRFVISGTDIVKVLLFRLEKLGKEVKNQKKIEEGIFSDLRNLKPGRDSLLESPKSPLLLFLHQNACVRTMKKQKVFLWTAVKHRKIFTDTVEREAKRDNQDDDSSALLSRSFSSSSLHGEPSSPISSAPSPASPSLISRKRSLPDSPDLSSKRIRVSQTPFISSSPSLSPNSLPPKYTEDYSDSPMFPHEVPALQSLPTSTDIQFSEVISSSFPSQAPFYPVHSTCGKGPEEFLDFGFEEPSYLCSESPDLSSIDFKPEEHPGEVFLWEEVEPDYPTFIPRSAPQSPHPGFVSDFVFLN